LYTQGTVQVAAEFQGCDVGVQGALGCGGDFAWFDCRDGFWEVLSTAAHAGVLQWQLSLLVGVVLLLHCKGGRVNWIVPSWIRWPSRMASVSLVSREACLA
jgi:hypothetical protein